MIDPNDPSNMDSQRKYMQFMQQKGWNSYKENHTDGLSGGKRFKPR